MLEATAFQTREVVEAMEKDSGIALHVLRTDGGMVENDLLMQFQADILDRPVVRPAIKETRRWAPLTPRGWRWDFSRMLTICEGDGLPTGLGLRSSPKKNVTRCTGCGRRQ